jgi:GT2 family glycosyltransferase/glycosyltransferase involved in cell wall biosynthesis
MICVLAKLKPAHPERTENIMLNNIDPAEQELLKLPFDQYQRYKIVQEAINGLRDALPDRGQPLRVLDVGGSPTTLKRFLPNDKVVVADLADFGGLDIYANGINLPFSSGVFDIVVSVDALEHVPPALRATFIGEMARVCRAALVLAAPFDDPKVVEAEEIFQELIWARFGEGYHFIEEHRAYGLPVLEPILEQLQAQGFVTAALPNGYLHRWLVTLSAFFLLQWQFQNDHFSQLINSYYNINFYRADNREPSYRKAVVALLCNNGAPFTEPDALLRLGVLSEQICRPVQTDPAERAAHIYGLNLLTTLLTESWSKRALESQERLEAAMRQLRTLEDRFSSQDNQLNDRQDVINSLENEINRVNLKMETLCNQLEETKQQSAQQLDLQLEQLEKLQNRLKVEEQQSQALNTRLLEILGSRAWKLVHLLWVIRLWLLPHKSKREQLVKRLLGRGSVAEPASQEAPGVAPSLEITPGLPSTYDIILFPIIDWDFRFQRPQHIARLMGQKGHRVFYLRTCFSSRLEVQATSLPGVLEVTLPGDETLNLYRNSLDLRTLQRAKVALLELQDRFQIHEAVMLVDLPFWEPLAKSLKNETGWKLVYDCMDHHAGFQNTAAPMLELENQLSAESDLILASSRSLYADRASHNPNCLLLPNAVEFDHFQQATNPVPQELKTIAHPIIGYYGAISSWFDARLVSELAIRRRQWSFVLIGDTWGSELKPLQGLANVYLLDEKPYAMLPAFLHQFDVCFIPFKKTPLTDATNPVKLFEFLSAGKPVVAADLDEIRNYSQYVHLASSTAEWLAALDSALNERDPQAVAARIQFSRQNTWQQRFQILDTAIQALYPKVSILILTFNSLEYNQLCLESVFANTEYPNYEVIVVDNASSDGTPAYLQSLLSLHTNLIVVLNPANAGFAGGNNQAAALADGEFLVFLNNDTVVPHGWLSNLLLHLQDPEIGLVGPVTNGASNESKIESTYQDLKDLDAFAAQRARHYAGQRFDIRVAALFCAAMRRSDFEAAGGLDERYGIGMFEDDDLAETIRRQGKRVICAEDTYVHHWGMAGFKQMGDEAYFKLFEENRTKYEAKWGLEWKQHEKRQ